MSELKPCPWCNRAPDPVLQSTDTRRENGDGYKVAVWCEPCGVLGPECDTEAAAIAAWNRRAPDYAAGAEAMREAAALEVDCACSWRADALAATNKGERFVACGNDPCGAIEARAIRALPLQEPPK